LVPFAFSSRKIGISSTVGLIASGLDRGFLDLLKIVPFEAFFGARERAGFVSPGVKKRNASIC
jgi:hypothetical protein